MTVIRKQILKKFFQGNNEIFSGVLVVNVTWRNRTYMGTLLDATKHDWAPPR